MKINKKISKIAITGGKGGTGKSTFAILLANKYLIEDQKVILCDLDVECPNDHLLLGKKLAEPTSFVYAQFPSLDETKCQKCGLCLKNCYNHTIFQAPGKFPVFLRDLCSGCGACWQVCPHGAIKKTREKIGEIYLNKISDNFWLITGFAQPGVGKTGLVVTDYVVAKTKEFVLKLTRQFKPDKIIFDTAAGTHCPVITGIMNSDFAYAVTEPTPMGAHDLRLILDLCQKLKVPAKIVLNQADLGNRQKVEQISQKFKSKIEIEIPYSKKIAQAYSAGKLKEIDLLK
jgi:MinD superfamily P-loop ATPase